MKFATCRQWLSILVVVTVILVGGRSAVADPAYFGTVHGVFSDPILAGHYLNNGGIPTFRDNTNTAVVSIPFSGQTAEIISGDNFGGAGSPSEIIFFGNTLNGAPPDTEIELGTLTFNNGTSGLSSSIYGATLTLFIPQLPHVTPVSTTFRLITTQNRTGFPGGTPGDAVLNADILRFPDPLNLNFYAFEANGATVKVMGRIFGDPVLQILSLELPPDQVENGLVSAVPEPSSAVLLGMGLLSLYVFRRATRHLTSKRAA